LSSPAVSKGENTGRTPLQLPVVKEVPISSVASSLPGADASKPGLVLFHSPVSGACRRVEGFLAQVLQRRQNHDTFRLYRVDDASRPDLLERFRVDDLPTLVVVESKAVRARLVQPRSCREIERFLSPWLK
jgi:thioredoxin-like negative regulator of GroEL